jgi:hypothetical protein
VSARRGENKIGPKGLKERFAGRASRRDLTSGLSGLAATAIEGLGLHETKKNQTPCIPVWAVRADIFDGQFFLEFFIQ